MPNGLGRLKDFMVITALCTVLSYLWTNFEAGCKIKWSHSHLVRLVTEEMDGVVVILHKLQAICLIPTLNGTI